MSELKIGFIIDPIESIRTDEDSTYLFMLESQRRDHTLYYMTVSDLYMAGTKPMAEVLPIEVFRGENYYRLEEKTSLCLDDLHVLFMRKDPPFDLNYYTATLILSMVHRKTLVINDPRSLRDNNEKISTLQFPELVPETVVTRRISRLQQFLKDQGGEIIVKPLFRSYGRDILHVQQDHINCNTLLEISTGEESRFVIAQRYLHDAVHGDKRIILLNGEPIGAVLWLPPEGTGDKPPIRTPWRETKTDLTERDREICETIAPYLRDNGLFFAGIDIIGSYLTEINITSPTCLPEINRLNNDCLEAKVIDFVEEEWARRRL